MAPTERSPSLAILPRLTYADLVTLPDDGKRYELLEGVLYSTGSVLPCPLCPAVTVPVATIFS